MTLTEYDLDTIDIRLHTSYSTAAGAVGDRSGLRLQLRADDGVVGTGETAPLPGASSGSLETVAAELRTWAEASIGGPDVESLLEGLDAAGLGPEARFAAHTALADLHTQRLGTPLAQWLRSGSPAVVTVNALVTDLTPKEVHQSVSTHVDAGFRSIKLKVGALDAAQDATRIIAASEAAGSRVELRLDANGGWSREIASHVVGRVGRHRISYIEDPTENLDDFSIIEAETGVRTALDCVPATPDEIRRDAERSGASVLVVKPVAIGGVDRVVSLARQFDSSKAVVVTSSIDHSVALAAAVHAAAALPHPNVSHGLATGPLVRGVDESLWPERGRVIVPTTPGVLSAVRLSV